ncbi:MAG: hypothetical protein K2I42_04230 [Anaeroplasmataceae bacterium]|nr:hypothetical protein [Anaeroplasmataceae bacterium]
MFLKLFKYDFRAVFFKFVPMMLVMIILAILARITISFKMMEMVSAMINGFFVFGCFISILYVIILCVMRYVQSLFKVQGYLTHTLPVSKEKLLLSQLLVDLIMAVIATVLVVVCLIIAYLEKSVLEGIKYLLDSLFKNVVIEIGVGSVVLVILTVIFSAVQWIFVIFLGIALGHIPPKNRAVFSILFCIALNYAINFASSILMSIINMTYKNANVISTQGWVNSIFGTALGFSIVVSIVCYFLIVYIMKKHLNLE